MASNWIRDCNWDRAVPAAPHKKNPAAANLRFYDDYQGRHRIADDAFFISGAQILAGLTISDTL